MVRTEEQLRKYPFFTLLSFEREADGVFVRVDGPPPQADRSRSHTGQVSLRLEGGTRAAAIQLAALHSGREWPGPWALVGAYVYVNEPQVLTVAAEAADAVLVSYTLRVPAGAWTPVLLDVASLPLAAARRIQTLRLSFDPPPAGGLWIDNVLEIDNRTVHVRTAPGGRFGAWSVEERGYRFTVSGAGFTQTLATPEAAVDGWVAVEINELRARFQSPDGSRHRIIYYDGREYTDGRLRLLAAGGYEGAKLAQHERPGRLVVLGERGRLDRNASGDANNDGYAERSGAWQVVAEGPRLEMRLEPEGGLMVQPIIEVRELPDGPVLVTMEGRLVERFVRLEDGRLLVEVPGVLERPTVVSVRVSQ